MKKFLYLIAPILAISCCFSCGNNGGGPKPPPVEKPITTVEVKNIIVGTKIKFEYDGDDDFTVDWGDSTTDQKAYHTYKTVLSEVTITIEGEFTEIKFASSDGLLDEGNALIESVQLCNTITTIPDYAFNSCAGLEEIIIPKNVTTIGGYAFKSCSNLIIYCEIDSQPDGWDDNWNPNNCPSYFGFVSSNNINGLKYCILKNDVAITRYVGDATRVDIPKTIEGKTVTVIGRSAFYNSSITSVALPDTLKTIESQAFQHCSSLISIFIPKSVEMIENYAFKSCSNLFICCGAEDEPTEWEDDWNANVERCYWGCTSQGEINGLVYFTTKDDSTIIKYIGEETDIVIPNKIEDKPVVAINGLAFYESSIHSAILPDTLKTIEPQAFQDCSSLTSIFIPKSVETIYRFAFSGSSNLIVYCEAETKPEGWSEGWDQSIDKCYWGCTSFGEVDGFHYIIRNNGAEIINYTGEDIDIEIPAEIEEKPVIAINDSAFSGSLVTSIILPNTLKTIEKNAFSNSELIYIYIPTNVDTIGESAFDDCECLSIYCEAEEKPTGWDDNWNPDGYSCCWGCKSRGTEDNLEYVITNEGAIIARYVGKEEGAEVIVPSTVASGTPVISMSAFVFSQSLVSSVTLSSAIKTISRGAFLACYSLVTVVIPDGVEEIGADAFGVCESLTDVTIPRSVHTIGDRAFGGCYSINQIFIPSTVTTMGEQVFSSFFTSVYCEAEEKPTGWDENWETGVLVYWGCTSYGKTELYCYVVVKHEAAVITRYIGEDREEVVLEIDSEIDGVPVTTIGDCAFADLYSELTIKSIKFPNTLKEIKFGAFYFCSLETIDLKSFTNPSDIPNAEDGAFGENEGAIFEVASQNMAEAFKTKGGGWPDTLDSYNWPGK